MLFGGGCILPHPLPLEPSLHINFKCVGLFLLYNFFLSLNIIQTKLSTQYVKRNFQFKDIRKSLLSDLQANGLPDIHNHFHFNVCISQSQSATLVNKQILD